MYYLANFQSTDNRDRNRNLALGSAVGAFLGSKVGEEVGKRSDKKIIRDNEYSNKGAVVGGALGFLGTGAAMSAYKNWKQNKSKKKRSNKISPKDVGLLGAGAGLGYIGYRAIKG